MHNLVEVNAIVFSPAVHRDGSEAPRLVDVILQNVHTQHVLFGASMDAAALSETLETGFVVLYSKSRKERWIKGETSGDKLRVVGIFLSCEKNQLLIQVIPIGSGVCHMKDEKGVGYATCFFSKIMKKSLKCTERRML